MAVTPVLPLSPRIHSTKLVPPFAVIEKKVQMAEKVKKTSNTKLQRKKNPHYKKSLLSTMLLGKMIWIIIPRYTNLQCNFSDRNHPDLKKGR